MSSLKRLYGIKESVKEGGPGSGPKAKGDKGSKPPKGLPEPDGDEGGGLPPEIADQVRQLIQSLEALVPDTDPEGDEPDDMDMDMGMDVEKESTRDPGPAANMGRQMYGESKRRRR